MHSCQLWGAFWALVWQSPLNQMKWPAQEEKYKEGCTLLQISLLSFVEAEKPDVDTYPASQHAVAVRC